VANAENLGPLRIENTKVLVTGAARGLGRALVAAFLDSGAARVFATFRNAESAAASGFVGDRRVERLVVDVTSDASVDAASRRCGQVDILVNNAAVIFNTPPLGAQDLDPARLEMETNYWGVLRMCRAFAPQLTASGNGAAVNILSIGALAPLPFCGSYCASKAAAWSATQSMRAEFRPRGVRVAAVFAGAIATDMSSTDIADRCPPETMAAEIVDALARGELTIFPDAASRAVAEIYGQNPWELARRFSGHADR
jgi:NAD(P)-dependent dehydrogenase (short-subunit alcohol dehydrogenase family)